MPEDGGNGVTQSVLARCLSRQGGCVESSCLAIRGWRTIEGGSCQAALTAPAPTAFWSDSSLSVETIPCL